MITTQASSTRRKGAAFGLRAIILAGGKGVRLQPFTVNFPKPLMPLGDKPIIDILIQRLTQYGVTDVTISLGHLGELLKAYFRQRRDILKRVKLRYTEETRPTGTAGSLSLVRGLKSTFLVMNGDLLTDLNLDELVAFHRQKNATLTIATHLREVKIDLGVLEFNQDHRIVAYHEKPVKTYHVSMGIYVYEPQVLKFIKRGEFLDFPTLVVNLLAAGEMVCAFPTACTWLDIGRPDDYARAQELFISQKSECERL